MLEKIELKKCPYCGGDADINEKRSGCYERFEVYCPECGLSTAAEWDKEDAVKVWNTIGK